jgi:hypothetical protein
MNISMVEAPAVETAVEALGTTSTNVDVQINPANNLQEEDIEDEGVKVANFIDRDGDGIPDDIDPDFIDTDGDGVVDALDADPLDPNLSVDTDGDLIDDSIDPDFIDSDGDGIVDALDPDLIDSDGDGIVDALDPDLIDSDGDGIVDALDPDLIDSDGDGIVDALDPDLIGSDDEDDQDGDDNKGHGNDEDGVDEDNPGNNKPDDDKDTGKPDDDKDTGKPDEGEDAVEPDEGEDAVEPDDDKDTGKPDDDGSVKGNKKDDCAIVLENCEDDSNGNGNGNGNNLAQSTDSSVRDLVEAYADKIQATEGQIAVARDDENTYLIVKVPVSDNSGLEASASFGDVSIDWGYWSLPGLLDGEHEISSEDFQRVYLAVIDVADMDSLKSTSGKWSYNSVPNQFTGGGTGGTLTGLDVGFDVDLNSGLVSNGSFNADVGYGAENWSMNFSGSVNGASATMNNFTDTVVFTPAGITNGIQGELGGVFTGSGEVNGFVTGFSLTNDLGGALGGLGLLEGSPE